MSKSKLSKIKALLGMHEDITLAAEAVLKDGTMIGTDAEEWAVGVLAYVVAETGEKMPLPTGEFELEDGRVLVIEDGTITEIREAEVVEEEVVEEVTEEVEAGVSKKELIAVLEQMNKDFDAKLEALGKEIKKDLTKFSASKPITKMSNRPQRVIVQKDIKEMNTAERALSIFNNSINN
tara:strand:- start:2755 stop:3291 length:537 start_codon:yes stop_codon:yes gene_type:complete